MALAVSITDPSTGVVTTYWRVAQINDSMLERQALATLVGYVSEDVRRRAGGQPAPVQPIQLQLAGEGYAAFAQRRDAGEAMQAVYELAKAAPGQPGPDGQPTPGPFAEAEDC